MPSEISLTVAEEGADAERVGALTGYLRQELLQLDVDDVVTATGGAAPAGSRGLDLTMVGGLLVSLGGSAAGLADVVGVIRSWLSRGGGVRRTVKLQIDGDVLELSEVSRDEQNRLVELFVTRHDGGR